MYKCHTDAPDVHPIISYTDNPHNAMSGFFSFFITKDQFFAVIISGGFAQYSFIQLIQVNFSSLLLELLIKNDICFSPLLFVSFLISVFYLPSPSLLVCLAHIIIDLDGCKGPQRSAQPCFPFYLQRKNQFQR